MLVSLDIFTDFADHLAVRKVLQGVKGRVEGHIEAAALANIEFATYVLAALVFFGAILLVLVRPLTWPCWLAALAAGIAWLTTWFSSLPWWGKVMLEALVLFELCRLFFWNP